MIDKIEVDQLIKAEDELRKPLNNIKKALTSIINYSSDRKLRKVIDLTIPYEFKVQIEKNRRSFKEGHSKEHNYGMIESSNTLFVAEKNILHLRNLFTGFQVDITTKEDIIFVKSLVPNREVFQESVSIVLLIASKHHLNFYVYRKDEDEFLDVQIEYKFHEPIKDIKVTDSGRIFAIHRHEMIEITYGRNTCSFYSFESSFLNYFLPFFFKKQKEEILQFDVKNKFLVTLKKREIEIYTIHKKIKKLNTIPINRLYKTIGIIEEENKITIVNGKKINGCLLICGVLPNGTRDYFSISHLIYSKPSPFEIKPSDILTVHDQNFLIQSEDKCTLVRINEDQFYNFDSNKASENYETLHDHFLQVGKRIFSFSDRVSVYEYLHGSNLLLQSNDPSSFLKNYGGISSLFYLTLYANGKNTYLIDYLFQNLDRKYIFMVVIELLKNVLDKPIQNMEYTIFDNLLSKFRNIERFDVFIKKVIGAIYFAKLSYEHRVIFINNITIRDLIFNRNAEHWNQCLKVLNLNTLKIRCYDFLSLDEIFYQNAKKLISMGTREAFAKAVEDLINVDANKEILELLIQKRYFIGATKLVKKMNLKYDSLVEILSNVLKCKESLDIALESDDQNFCFAVFDSYLKNDMRFEECVCCDEKIENFHICYIKHKFIESFFKEKFYNSQNKNEYDLYWRYLIYNKRKKEGIDALNNILRIKTTDLNQKIRYLNILYAFDSSAKLSLNLAQIQKEISQRMNKEFDELIDAEILFNDYAYKYGFYDLALKILDICDCEREILFDVMYKYLSGPIDAIESKLLKLNLTGRCLDLNVLVSILSFKKMNKKVNICEILEKLKFKSERIIEGIKEELRYNISLDAKKYLLDCVENRYGITGNLMV